MSRRAGTRSGERAFSTTRCPPGSRRKSRGHRRQAIHRAAVLPALPRRLRISEFWALGWVPGAQSEFWTPAPGLGARDLAPEGMQNSSLAPAAIPFPPLLSPCLANRFNRSHPQMERASTSRFWPPRPLHPRPPPPNPTGSAPQAYSSCVLGGPGDPLGTQTLSKLTPCWRRSRQGVAVYPAPRKVGPRGSAGQSRPLRPRAPPAPRWS